ncbi:MAG: hypothetical protein K0U52_07380 [Gammaproteobacteria bacterium]|nr:hypothetical protein [Gammaproteobacteria bacterium]
MSDRSYYTVETADIYVEATIKVKINMNERTSVPLEELVIDYTWNGEFTDVEVKSIDFEEYTNIQEETEEVG